MPTPLSGPGVGLPLPQNLYPSELGNSPYDFSSNKQALAPGQELPIPAGNWYVNLGSYLVLEFLDPITGVWQFAPATAWNGAVQYVKSDGFNVRIANRTGCLVGAVVTSYGNGSYVQASTAIAVTGSTATFLPIIGGQLSVSGTFTVAVPTQGAGYGVPPMLFIPSPPPAANNANGVGGIPATAWLGMRTGTVSGVTFNNPGAGYPSAPTPVVLPNPTDPNIATGITQASVAFSLTGAGSLTGVLCTNSGAPLVNGSLSSITLSVTGAGATASVAALIMQTVLTATVTGPGTGYGTALSPVMTTGGGASAGTITNSPEFLGLAFRPRQAQIAITPGNTSVSAATVGTIYDGGLFLSAPTAAFPISGAGGTGSTFTLATVGLMMGGTNDIALFQPAP
ncbi:MAG TPA: hypothetical protein VLJ17_24470 [Xanthobacteraceae bacterium]|nr:hypothetical protein [Xanthobacteraceae bacterium]